MMSCDLCGKTAACLQMKIENKEFDICEKCWRPLADKLSGKGRLKEEILTDMEEYVETTV